MNQIKKNQIKIKKEKKEKNKINKILVFNLKSKNKS